MSTTVNFGQRQPEQKQATDQNGYYSITVKNVIDQDPQNGTTETVIKVKQPIKPADGTEEVKVGITLDALTDQSITIPAFGFTINMGVVYVSRVGDLLQAVIAPSDVFGLLNVGANYVETMVVTVPFTEDNYIKLSPGTKYFITIDLAQPPVTAVEDQSEKEIVDDVVKDDPPVAVEEILPPLDSSSQDIPSLVETDLAEKENDDQSKSVVQE